MPAKRAVLGEKRAKRQHPNALCLTRLCFTVLRLTDLRFTGLRLTGLGFTDLRLTGLGFTRLRLTGLGFTRLRVTELRVAALIALVVRQGQVADVEQTTWSQHALELPEQAQLIHI